MTTITGNPESLSMNVLSVVLLGSDEARRQAVVSALNGTQAQIVRQGPLPQLDALPTLLDSDCDILIIDIEGDRERSLELVEAAQNVDPGIVIMVYARVNDPELIVRCMRAGAREFLRDPLSPAAVTDALVHAAVRRDEDKAQKKLAGKCLVFTGAKGGSGVTTIASNFAVALAKANAGGVALLDLDLELGDAALSLGVSGDFTSLDALENESRLDSDLVAKMLVRHSSGLMVLGAPNQHHTFQPTLQGVTKLITILRQDFPWVVVDAGTSYRGYEQTLFEIAERVYLVTQVSLTELRNANRIVTSLFQGERLQKLSVVLNRYSPKTGDIDQRSIEDALTVTPAWRVPSDYYAVHAAQNAATALVSRDGPVSRVLTQMAQAACGSRPPEVKKRFRLFS